MMMHGISMMILEIKLCDVYDGWNGDSFSIILIINYRYMTGLERRTWKYWYNNMHL